jgi:predicted MFS family arabinose efflux permease
MAFTTHFTLMGPFLVISALWGFPYLVQAQHLTRGQASAVLLLLVIVFAVVSPAVGGTVARLPHVRDVVARGAATVLLAAWTVLLAWPGRAPLAVVLVVFCVSAAGSATSMLAFDMARADSPPSYGGTATGLANCGGFLAAGVASLGVGVVLDALGAPTAAHYRVALVPVVALVALGTAMLWRMHLAPASARDAYPVA